MISSLVILKSSTLSNSSIFSLNSGIIDIAADLNVYLVNSMVCPAWYVSSRRIVLIANDLPEPLPPVMM